MRRVNLNQGLSMAALAVLADAILHSFLMSNRAHRNRGARGKRCRSGYVHPHSSTRQRARYARQIAAGQLHIEGC